MTGGREYSLWGWARNRQILADKLGLLRLLRRIVIAIDMTVLGQLAEDVEYAVEAQGRKPFEDEGGSSAIVMLSTSHAAIHGWPWRDGCPDCGWFSLQVSSCRDYRPELVRRIVDTELQLERVREHELPLEEM